MCWHWWCKSLFPFQNRTTFFWLILSKNWEISQQFSYRFSKVSGFSCFVLISKSNKPEVQFCKVNRDCESWEVVKFLTALWPSNIKLREYFIRLWMTKKIAFSSVHVKHWLFSSSKIYETLCFVPVADKVALQRWLTCI